MADKPCRACDGRGFHWKHSELVSRQTGLVIADLKKQGETCSECKGDGKAHEVSGILWALLIGALIAAFILYNIPDVPV